MEPASQPLGTSTSAAGHLALTPSTATPSGMADSSTWPSQRVTGTSQDTVRSSLYEEDHPMEWLTEPSPDLTTILPAPAPQPTPPNALTRCNPSRNSRPPGGIDLDDAGLLDETLIYPEDLPGLLTEAQAAAILRKKGPTRIAHPRDIPDMWSLLS